MRLTSRSNFSPVTCVVRRFCFFCKSLFTMLSVSLVLFFLFSSSAVLGADDYRTCYYPGGNKALGHMPCSDEEQTACCASDHICMANGLCIEAGSSQPYGFSRAACTDRNWGAGMVLVTIMQHRITKTLDAQLYHFTPTETTARTAATRLCQMEALPSVTMIEILSNSQAVRSSQGAHTSRT